MQGPQTPWTRTRGESRRDREKRRRGRTARKREGEKEREDGEKENGRSERVSNVRTYTSGSASARALTSPLSVQARQPAVHPPWATVDSSLGCHDDRSTARAVGASETPSRGRRWKEWEGWAGERGKFLRLYGKNFFNGKNDGSILITRYVTRGCYMYSRKISRKNLVKIYNIYVR